MYRAPCTWLFSGAGSEDWRVSERWEGFIRYSGVLSTVRQGKKNGRKKAAHWWCLAFIKYLPSTTPSWAPTMCQALCSVLAIQSQHSPEILNSASLNLDSAVPSLERWIIPRALREPTGVWGAHKRSCFGLESAWPYSISQDICKRMLPVTVQKGFAKQIAGGNEGSVSLVKNEEL